MDGDSGAPTGVILTAIGGVVMAVAAVLTWLKVAIDVDAFAKAIGVDPSTLAGAIGQTSKTFAGTKGGEGKVALACGVVALVVAVAAYARRELWKTLGWVSIVAGGVGVASALKVVADKANIIGDAKNGLSSTLAAAGIDPSILDNIFKATIGIGVLLCIAGGASAIVGGVMLLMKQSSVQPAMAGMPGGAVPPMSDSGFGTSSVGGSMAAPASPPPPPMDAPAMSEPASPPPADPAPPATGTTAGDEGGATTTTP